LAVLGIFFIQLFPNWTACSPITYTNFSLIYPSTGALIDNLDLELVGPFDVLSEKFKNIDDKTITSYHLHWRYYYDPPEFQTVIRACNNDQDYHIGYFR
jgi:hypothetical protein